MRVTILGSGTLSPDSSRGSAAHLVETTGAHVLLDCGAGTVRSLAERGWEGLTHLILSHFHVDHVGDVPGLFWALAKGRPRPGPRPLTVLGPPGTNAWLARVAAAFGDYILAPGAPLRVVELGTGHWRDDTGAQLEVSVHPTPHADPSIAVRLETPGGATGYTGDTGPAAGLATFFAGVDVAISECGTREEARRAGHLAPSDVAALWTRADPGVLCLTHVDPVLGPAEAERRVRGAGYVGALEMGWDGLTLPMEEAVGC
ncbi:MAG: ribonuclease Z [Gemmatimonadota bacterium]